MNFEPEFNDLCGFKQNEICDVIRTSEGRNGTFMQIYGGAVFQGFS